MKKLLIFLILLSQSAVYSAGPAVIRARFLRAKELARISRQTQGTIPPVVLRGSRAHKKSLEPCTLEQALKDVEFAREQLLKEKIIKTRMYREERRRKATFWGKIFGLY